jgi:dihydrofolate reductase
VWSAGDEFATVVMSNGGWSMTWNTTLLSRGDLLIWGSGSLTRALLAEGLVDELSLMIEPILLGSGKRIIPEDGAACRSASTTRRRRTGADALPALRRATERTTPTRRGVRRSA